MFLCRYVNGKTYMEDVADALEEAKEEIFITDWWWVAVCKDACQSYFGWSVTAVKLKCEKQKYNPVPCFNISTSIARSSQRAGGSCIRETPEWVILIVRMEKEKKRKTNRERTWDTAGHLSTLTHTLTPPPNPHPHTCNSMRRTALLIHTAHCFVHYCKETLGLLPDSLPILFPVMIGYISISSGLKTNRYWHLVVNGVTPLNHYTHIKAKATVPVSIHTQA